MQQNSVKYIVGFAGVVCLICSLLVSTTATVLKDTQKLNRKLDKQMKVLSVSGLVEANDRPTAKEIEDIFGERIEIVLIEMPSGKVVTDSGIDPATYDWIKAGKDPELGHDVDSDPSKVTRVADVMPVYVVKDEQGMPDLYVLPIEGMGLWGFLYGFLALDTDMNTIEGLTYYKHKETPGLGAEVDNPNWKAKWPGRLAFDSDWNPTIGVIKGAAGSPSETPYEVDGLSGATLTSNGVTNMLQFWLGDQGFGPYLAGKRNEGSSV
jgi:Na+-transporting NADH:ubiquinone oxidoreductase subunit C